jgi:hypothetical protein
MEPLDQDLAGGEAPSPKGRVSLGGTDHDRHERERPTQTKPAGPARASASVQEARQLVSTPAKNASMKRDVFVPEADH